LASGFTGETIMTQYISTRGGAGMRGFEDVLLAGLAEDGGLFVPDAWPRFAPGFLESLAGMPYADAAAEIMLPFIGDAIDRPAFIALARSAYSRFAHAAVTPLVQLDQRTWLLELFHGPTLAFKDVALQMLGQLFDHVLARSGRRITVVGATSGDTGSAAIEACRDREAVDIFILYPAGRTSAVQRKQMTTVPSANVHAIAIEGDFDDCQALVKAMFADAPFRDGLSLAAVNSINWARIMAQIVYYVVSAVALGAPGRAVSFAVPTGNFGNIYAAYAASRMGLPIERLIVGTNSNDILARFFATAEMRKAETVPTYSPSMDIQVSSNFERLLFELGGRDPDSVKARMTEFAATGAFRVTSAMFADVTGLFSAAAVDDDATKATIGDVYRRTGLVLDPHSAVGVAAARRLEDHSGAPVIALACAHPAKFPEVVTEATGLHPALPSHLADLFDRPERLVMLPNDFGTVQSFIRGHARIV
jgi:threonine synthase